MTRKEAEYLYAWLRDTYPRNYREADARREATTIDNLAKVFAYYRYTEVQAEYERMFGFQKTEPHPSEVRAHLRAEEKQAEAIQTMEPYEKLRRHPKYAEMERAYGERACRRAAKLCVETASIDELKYRLETDRPCREGDFLAVQQTLPNMFGR